MRVDLAPLKGEPVPGTAAVLDFSENPHEPPATMNSGDVDLHCGHCGFRLVAASAPGQFEALIFRCRCGGYSRTRI